MQISRCTGHHSIVTLGFAGWTVTVLSQHQSCLSPSYTGNNVEFMCEEERKSISHSRADYAVYDIVIPYDNGPFNTFP